MMELLRIADPSELAQLPPGPVQPLGAFEWSTSHPDLHLVLVDEGQTVARCSVWWADGPAWPDDPACSVGRVGHLEIHSHGVELISAALDELRAAGCGAVLGPMDGSTWNAYRLVTRDAPQGGTPMPPFAMEPFPSQRVGLTLQSGGFEPVARYVSAWVAEIPNEAESWELAQQRLAAEGIRVRPLDAENVDRDLRAIHALALDAFAQNVFYTPCPQESFLTAYKSILARAEPRLILLAERGEALVGTGFALPDLEKKARREHVDTVIVKTVAVAPSERGVGLGSALTLGMHESARSLGFTRAIHALMHEANTSVRISRHTAVPMRRYALLGRKL